MRQASTLKNKLAGAGTAIHALGCPTDGVPAIALKAASLAGASAPAALKPFQKAHDTLVGGVEKILYHNPQVALPEELAHEIAHGSVEAAGWAGIAYTAYAWGPSIAKKTKQLGEQTYHAVNNLYNTK